jgi:shikimate dehydrogenase
VPHKVATVALLDEITPTVAVAGSCNAVRLDETGRLIGDMFDGEGFVRGIERKGRKLSEANALVIGSGGVGSAIVASLAKGKVAKLGVCDVDHGKAQALAGRLTKHYPRLQLILDVDFPRKSGGLF